MSSAMSREEATLAQIVEENDTLSPIVKRAMRNLGRLAVRS
jgi:hypothetical protein